MHLAAEVIKVLVLLPLLHICRRLARRCRVMGIGASLPERLVRAVNQNDAKSLSEVCFGASLSCVRVLLRCICADAFGRASRSVRRGLAGLCVFW